jgi:hypothetical protein
MSVDRLIPSFLVFLHAFFEALQHDALVGIAKERDGVSLRDDHSMRW